MTVITYCVTSNALALSVLIERRLGSIPAVDDLFSVWYFAQFMLFSEIHCSSVAPAGNSFLRNGYAMRMFVISAWFELFDYQSLLKLFDSKKTLFLRENFVSKFDCSYTYGLRNKTKNAFSKLWENMPESDCCNNSFITMWRLQGWCLWVRKWCLKLIHCNE